MLLQAHHVKTVLAIIFSSHWLSGLDFNSWFTDGEEDDDDDDDDDGGDGDDEDDDDDDDGGDGDDEDDDDGDDDDDDDDDGGGDGDGDDDDEDDDDDVDNDDDAINYIATRRFVEPSFYRYKDVVCFMLWFPSSVQVPCLVLRL
ncbi:hypothetical protein ElyMa_002873700 [Elysia marginata]|uniref:Uncharacterized protein n=1 Tax=Elysia marginata TaxID=1093978 RepID=A0AAV4HZR7_9GAST|nr:hypothetical protein ElyMa_002873700 [Elysia marginata]